MQELKGYIHIISNRTYTHIYIYTHVHIYIYTHHIILTRQRASSMVHLRLRYAACTCMYHQFHFSEPGVLDYQEFFNLIASWQQVEQVDSPRHFSIGGVQTCCTSVTVGFLWQRECHALHKFKHNLIVGSLCSFGFILILSLDRTARESKLPSRQASKQFHHTQSLSVCTSPAVSDLLFPCPRTIPSITYYFRGGYIAALASIRS